MGLNVCSPFSVPFSKFQPFSSNLPWAKHAKWNKTAYKHTKHDQTQFIFFCDYQLENMFEFIKIQMKSCNFFSRFSLEWNSINREHELTHFWLHQMRKIRRSWKNWTMWIVVFGYFIHAHRMYLVIKIVCISNALLMLP